MNQIVKPIYEFLLWDNCSNNCKFCFQRKNPRIFSLEEQRKILTRTIDYIKSDEFVPGSHVLAVGGEIFDNPERKPMLDWFFDQIIQLMKGGRIDLFYLNTNLIYSENVFFDCLIPVLYAFQIEGLAYRLKFTTSYDLSGRFRTEESRIQFLNNLDALNEEVDEIKTVVNMILTKEFCQKTVNDEFNVYEFMMEHHCDLNLIPYIVLDRSLMASRVEIFNAIRHIYGYNPQFVVNWLHNIDLKQPRKMFYMKDDQFISCECGLSGCGHSENFKKYSDSGSCFVCDMKEMFNDCF